VNVGFAIV